MYARFNISVYLDITIYIKTGNTLINKNSNLIK